MTARGGWQAGLTSWIGVGAAWIGALALLGFWLLTTSPPVLRAQLTVMQFWSLEVCVALSLGLGAWLARELSRSLTTSDAVAIGLLASAALAVTLLVPPRTNRIYYDEQIYQGVGQNLSDLKRAQMCNDGNVEYGRLQCWSGEYNKQPYAYPHLLGLAYRVVGVRSGVAFVVNAAAMVASVVGVYLLAWLLFASRTSAVFAGLVFTLTPQQLIWSATAAVEPTASMACVLALVAVAHARHASHVLALAAAGVLLAYAWQFRPESPLLLLASTVLLVGRGRAWLTEPHAWWLALGIVLLTAVPIAHLFLVRHEGWGTEAARLSFDYIIANLRTNGPFYFADERFPGLYAVLALAGASSRGRGTERMALGTYFFAFFLITLAFYAGSYDYGADVRYSLMTYPPIAVLAGVGINRLIDRVATARLRPAWSAGVGAVLVLQFLSYMPLVRATTEEAWAARADVRFAQAFAERLPSNAYVLTHNPSMFHVWGTNAGQLGLAADNPLHLAYLQQRFTGGVYVHWNYWCNVAHPIQSSLCDRVLSRLVTTVESEYRERDQRYAFHRITGFAPAQ